LIGGTVTDAGAVTFKGKKVHCNMKNLLAFIVLFLPALAAFPQPNEVQQKIREVEAHLSGWVHTQYDRDWTIAERMAHYRLKGVSIAVINNSKVEWARGYGWADSSEGRPVTAATLFQAASISKSLNGVGVMRLVQDGLLDLNADVNQYLKGWKFRYDSVSKGKKITMVELLSHTAGLTVHGFPGYDIKDSSAAALAFKRHFEQDTTRSWGLPENKILYSLYRRYE